MDNATSNSNGVIMAKDNTKMNEFFDKFDFDTEDPSYNLGDEDYSLDEETGQLNFPDESKTSNDLKEGESKDAVADGDEPAGASDGTGSSHSIEDSDDPVAKSPMFKKLESSFDTLLDAVHKLTEQVVSRKTSEVEQEDDDFDFSDQDSVKKSLKKMIQESIKEAIAPMQQSNKQVQLQNEAAQLRAEQPNLELYLPAMKAVLEINPELGVRQAYDAARKITGELKPKTTNQDSDTKQTNQQVKKEPVKKPVAGLVEKAASIETASGVSSSVKEKKRASSFNDALDSAFEELGLK